jgi:hypothetical protein
MNKALYFSHASTAGAAMQHAYSTFELRAHPSDTHNRASSADLFDIFG